MILQRQISVPAVKRVLTSTDIFGPVLPAGITKVKCLKFTNTDSIFKMYIGDANITDTPTNAGIQISTQSSRDFGPFNSYVIDLAQIFIVPENGAFNPICMGFIVI